MNGSLSLSGVLITCSVTGDRFRIRLEETSEKDLRLEPGVDGDKRSPFKELRKEDLLFLELVIESSLAESDGTVVKESFELEALHERHENEGIRNRLSIFLTFQYQLR